MGNPKKNWKLVWSDEFDAPEINRDYWNFEHGYVRNNELQKYVDTPEKVTLNVKNATFKTAKKAAIMVKSAAGAEIKISNINITEVAKDATNAVWVDADAAAHAEKVVVTGATCITEP
jgi:hypothetical protein